MEEKKKQHLEVGEKYLSLVVEFGGIPLHFVAFKNKDKKKPEEPDFINRFERVAIWVQQKKQGEAKVEEVI